MAKTGNVNGIPLKESENEAINCNGYILGKGHRSVRAGWSSKFTVRVTSSNICTCAKSSSMIGLLGEVVGGLKYDLQELRSM